MTVLISVVIPVYKAEGIVPLLVKRLKESLQQISGSYEVILVEDGSPDSSWEQIEAECLSDQRIKGIKLSRNFGQHNAIFAGLEHAKGEWIVVMDCDLQDRPEEIPGLYQKAQEGYEIVLAARVVRKDFWIKKYLSGLFYRILSFLTDTPFNHQISNFGIYHEKVIQALRQLQETFKIFPLMVRWAGFYYTVLPVQHAEREVGTSSYNLRKLIRLGANIVLSYSEKLLRMTVKLGLIISIGSIIIALYYLYAYLSGQILVLGYASIIISLWLLGGLIITILGILGLYIGKIFEEIKKRPYALVHRTLNLEKE